MNSTEKCVSSLPYLGKRLAWRPNDPAKLGSKAMQARDSFENKLKKNIYKIEPILCFCGASQDILLSTVERHGLYYPLVVCRSCGLVRNNPRLTPDSYSSFYESDYRALYGDDDADLTDRYNKWLQQGHETFRYISGHLGLIQGVVLDVGCNTGAQLIPFREAGCEVYGVDYGSRYLDYGRKKTGISTLFHGGIEKFMALGKKADLVILSHVFEHMLDLEKELRKVRLAMAETGSLYISVPGTYWWIDKMCGGNIRYLLQNAHTYQFSLTSLTFVLECCGFIRTCGDERICALFKKSSSYRSKMEQPKGEAEKILWYLKRCEQRYLPKWWIGLILDCMGLKGFANRCRSSLANSFRR